MQAADAYDVCSGRVPFGVELFEFDPATVVAARGELDLATVPALRRSLAGLSGVVVLDLRRVSFVDVAGLRLLLELESHSRCDGLEFRLIPGSAAERLLRLAGVSERFRLAPEGR